METLTAPVQRRCTRTLKWVFVSHHLDRWDDRASEWTGRRGVRGIFLAWGGRKEEREGRVLGGGGSQVDKEKEKGRLPSLRSWVNVEEWLKSRGTSLTCHRDSSQLLCGAGGAESVQFSCCCHGFQGGAAVLPPVVCWELVQRSCYHRGKMEISNGATQC